jgi:hypothetical protein
MEKMSTLETGILRKPFSISDRNAAEVTPRPPVELVNCWQSSKLLR